MSVQLETIKSWRRKFVGSIVIQHFQLLFCYFYNGWRLNLFDLIMHILSRPNWHLEDYLPMISLIIRAVKINIPHILTWDEWGIWATSARLGQSLSCHGACRESSGGGRSGSWAACLSDRTSPRTSWPPSPGGWTTSAEWCLAPVFCNPSCQDWYGPEIGRII